MTMRRRSILVFFLLICLTATWFRVCIRAYHDFHNARTIHARLIETLFTNSQRDDCIKPHFTYRLLHTGSQSFDFTPQTQVSFVLIISALVLLIGFRCALFELLHVFFLRAPPVISL